MKKLKIYIYIVFFVLLWLILMLLSINNDSYMIIVKICSCALIIPLFFGFVYFTFIQFKRLFETKKWYLIITGIIIIISIVLFICGISILLFATPLENKYNVDTVNVLDVRNNKILVDYSIYNHGDYKVIEINKPFFTNIREGDIINVRYPVSNPKKMYYVLDGNIGEKLLKISLSCVVIMMIIWGLAIPVIMTYFLIFKKR